MAEQKKGEEPREEAQKKEPAKKSETIIFKDKQARIIMSLRNREQEWYISSLAKATDTTYVHTCKFVGMCESAGFTTSERHGKVKVIKLTDKGEQLADMVAGIYGLMGQQVRGKEQPQLQAQKKTE